MPIEELLAMYNCVTPPIQTFVPSGSGSKRRSKTSRNAGLDKTLMPPPETPKTVGETSTSIERVKDDVKSEDAATAETENKPNTNAETAETAAAAASTSTPITNTTDTVLKEDDDDGDHKEEISTGTAKKSKTTDDSDDNDAANDDNEDDDDKSKKADTAKQTSTKTNELKDESTESNTSDKENNVKDNNNLNTDTATATVVSGHANSASTKADIDAVDTNTDDGKIF